MQTRRVSAALFAAALLSGACTSSGEEVAAALPPAPPIDDSIDTIATFPDDGLTRYIITPISSPEGESPDGDGLGGDGQGDAGQSGDGPSDGWSSDDGEAPGDARDDGPQGTTGPGAAAGERSTHVTPEMVAAMPDGATLTQQDGQLGFIDDDGAFVALADAIDDHGSDLDSTGAEPRPDDRSGEEADPAEPGSPPSVSYGHPDVDELAADPAVETVTAIGDGTYGVTVSDPSVIDPTRFTITEDVPLGHAAEHYEGYQWGLENDGESLQGVRRIDQVEDADLDVGPIVGRIDGSGVVVAVIDSGVDFSHPDLWSAMWSNPDEICGNSIDDDNNGFVDDCNGWDFGNGDAVSYQPGANPHGTHVAGIITADRNGQGVAGVAPGAMIMDLNVGQTGGAGESITGAAVAAAIRYAVDNGADVINLSLGTEPGLPETAVAPMASAIDHAAANGVIVVAAAGNHGIDIESAAVYPASLDRPNMLVVGASTPSDTRAQFSNHSAEIVDFYAPGELILSTMPGEHYEFMSGTSQASPAVAASVALVLEQQPEATAAEIIDILTATVDRNPSFSTSSTSGRVNSARAVGIEGDSSIPTRLDVAVSGLRDVADDPDDDVAASVHIATPPDAFDEPYHWELTLVHSDETGAYAVVDHPVTIDGAAQATTDIGSVELLGAEGASAVGVATIEVSTRLPAGRYSFVIEAVPTADSSFRLGDAFVASFEIPGDPGDGDPISTVPITTRPEATPSTGAGADGSTSTGGGSGDDGSSGSAGTATTTTTTSTPAGGDGSSNGPDPSTTSAGSSTTTTRSDGGTGGSGGTDGTDPSDGSGADGPDADPSTDDPGSGPTTTRPDSGGTATSTSTTEPEGGPTTPVGDGGGDTSGGGAAGDAGDPPAGLGGGVAKKGAWESTSVEPQVGLIDTANLVSIAGYFPTPTYVWFGDQLGQVVFQDREVILVRTSLHAERGIVDITLRKSRHGTVLTIPDAYAFVGDDGTLDEPDDGDQGDDPGDGDIDDPDGGDGDGDDPDGGDGGGDGAGGGDGSDGQPGDDGTSDRSDRRARMSLGDRTELANGLVGRPITPDLTSAVRLCTTDPCPTVRR